MDSNKNLEQIYKGVRKLGGQTKITIKDKKVESHRTHKELPINIVGAKKRTTFQQDVIWDAFKAYITRLMAGICERYPDREVIFIASKIFNPHNVVLKEYPKPSVLEPLWKYMRLYDENTYYSRMAIDLNRFARQTRMFMMIYEGFINQAGEAHHLKADKNYIIDINKERDLLEQALFQSR